MKKLTLQDKMRVVLSDDNLREEYEKELQERQINTGEGRTLKIGKKRVGHWEYENARKYAASFVYDRHFNKDLQ